jgi:hypothetical protein
MIKAIFLAALAATAAPALTYAQVPKTNDILGVFTGDTENKVLGTMKSSGYVLGNKMQYQASTVSPVSTAELAFVNESAGSIVRVKFTPVTGRVMCIEREDNPKEKPLYKAVVDAMVAKYGQPTEGYDNQRRMEWRVNAAGVPENTQYCKFLVNISRNEAQRCGISIFGNVSNVSNPQLAYSFKTTIWDYRVQFEDILKREELSNAANGREINKAQGVAVPKL